MGWQGQRKGREEMRMTAALEFSDVSVVAQGPLWAAVRAEVKYGQSTISITVTCFSC